MGWLNGWKYRKSYIITGSADGIQTDYQVGIKAYYGNGTDGTESYNGITIGKVYLGAKCNTDFSDLRFTDNTGQWVLSYWIDPTGSSDGNYAIIWVKIPTIPASPDTVTIYIYYGNVDATTTSNGTNTFIRFDDCNSSSTDGTQVAQTVHSTDGSTQYCTAGSLYDMTVACVPNYSGGNRTGILDLKARRPNLGQTSHYVAGHAGLMYNSIGTQQIAVDFDYYNKELYCPTYFWVVYVYVVFKFSDGYRRMVRIKDHYRSSAHQFRWTGYFIGISTHSGEPEDRTTVLAGDGLDTWYQRFIKSISYHDEGVTDVYVGIGSGYDNNYGYGAIETYFDNIRIRKCVEYEPSPSSWGTEETFKPSVGNIAVLMSTLGLI